MCHLSPEPVPAFRQKQMNNNNTQEPMRQTDTNHLGVYVKKANTSTEYREHQATEPQQCCTSRRFPDLCGLPHQHVPSRSIHLARFASLPSPALVVAARTAVTESRSWSAVPAWKGSPPPLPRRELWRVLTPIPPSSLPCAGAVFLEKNPSLIHCLKNEGVKMRVCGQDDKQGGVQQGRVDGEDFSDRV